MDVETTTPSTPVESSGSRLYSNVTVPVDLDLLES